MYPELSPKAAEIAAHARALLADGGYNSFSYADIAERVHIRKASIHHHFPSKAELVHAVVARYREEARQGMAAMDREIADPLAELNAYISYWSRCIREGSSPFCICAMLATEMPTIPAPVAAEVRGHFEELAAWLASLLRRGRTRGQFHLHASANAEARALMATVHGAMLSARALDDAKAFDAVVRPAMDRLTSTD